MWLTAWRTHASAIGCVSTHTWIRRPHTARRVLHAVSCLMSAACCLHNAFRLIPFVVPRCPLQLASLHAVLRTSSAPHSPRHVVCCMPSTTRCACPPRHVVCCTWSFSRARAHTLRRIGMVGCGAGSGGSQAGGRGAVPAATGLSRAPSPPSADGTNHLIISHCSFSAARSPLHRVECMLSVGMLPVARCPPHAVCCTFAPELLRFLLQQLRWPLPHLH